MRKIQFQTIIILAAINFFVLVFWMVPLYLAPASLERYAWEEFRVLVVGGMLVATDIMVWLFVSRKPST